jgi:hypothetical protein
MTLKEIYRTAKANGQAEICRFMRDMKKAGLRMRPYNGRFYWHGPAVSADCVADVMSETRVKCQHDSMGLGVIVYPYESLRGVDRV